MKPAAQHHRTRPPQALLTAFTKGASVIALCAAGLFGHAMANSLPTKVNLDLHHKLEVASGTPKISNGRLNQIFQDFQKPGAMLEQAALSWPPQFAIGQTWTIGIVGVGIWNLPLTETIEGDATGYTTGTDKREGYFKYIPKNGNDPDLTISYLQSDTDIYECGFFAAGNPSGNTLNGVAFRYVISTKKLEDLKTTCSATLGGSSQTTTPTSPFANPNVPLNPNANQTQPSAASPVWPPKPGEAWTMTIDGLAPWLINFESLDKGDPTGRAVQSGAKFVAFAYQDKDGYEFELSDDVNVYFCTFASLQVQGNAFIGGKAYGGPKSANSIPSLNKSCSAAIGSSASASTNTAGSTLSWPPQLAVGQNWDFRLGARPVVYHGNFTSVTNNIFKGDLITEGSSDPITKRVLSVLYSAKDNAMISLAEDPQGGMTGCLFIGKESIKNNAYSGVTSYRAPGAKDFVDQNLECRMNNVTSTVATGMPSAPSSTPVWPPKPNENWSVTIDGLAPWLIKFETLDKDGDPTGSATQSGTAFTAFAFSDTGVAGAFQMINRQTNDSYYCAFKTFQVQGNSYVGGVALYQAKGGQASVMNKSCSAAIGSSAAANTNTGGSTLSGIFGNTNSNSNTNTNTGLGWPVQVAVGQNWTVNVKNLAFQLKLERINNGITIGTATAGKVELAGGFVNQGDNLNLILTDGTATIICTFGRSSVQAQTLNGQATYTEKPGATEQSWGACSATLGAKASTAANPLNLKRNNVLEAQVLMLRHFLS
jgi:hypothetical protein